MSAQNKSQSETANALEVFTFNYSESKQTVRTLLVDGEVFFIGSDVAKTLGYKNPRKALADHCKHVTKRYTLTNGGSQLMNTIPEGDVFRLIINSQLPSAQAFETFVMDELLPTLRKKGYYSMSKQKKTDFIDARDVPYVTEAFQDYNIRVIFINGEKFYSLNDVNSAIRSTTPSNQISKKLNAKQILARKIWLFGNTNPAWFVNQLGLQLVLSGSRIFTRTSQLTLNFDA